MARELPKVYDPNQVEDRIYKMWEEGKFFQPSGNKDAKPFTIVQETDGRSGNDLHHHREGDRRGSLRNRVL